MKLREWFRLLIRGVPHFIIGGIERPYLIRWYLIPRNPVFNIYLHKFVRDDDDRALHDHPWWFASFMIRGGYREVTTSGLTRRRAPSLVIRRAEYRHRVVLNRDHFGRPVPCWTIFITGPKVREWGFWCPDGWRHWKIFTDPADSGKVGRGCE